MTSGGGGASTRGWRPRMSRRRSLSPSRSGGRSAVPGAAPPRRAGPGGAGGGTSHAPRGGRSAATGPPLVRHLVRGDHVEVRREPSSLVVPHRVDRHRRHLVARLVDDREAEVGQREHPDVELDAGHDLPGLDATDRARGDADACRELSLAQVGEASCPNHIPTRLVVDSPPAPVPVMTSGSRQGPSARDPRGPAVDNRSEAAGGVHISRARHATVAWGAAVS